jgi:hypothetical protein
MISGYIADQASATAWMMYDGIMTNPENSRKSVPTMSELARDLHDVFETINVMMHDTQSSTRDWQILAQAQAAVGLASGIIHEHRYPHIS